MAPRVSVCIPVYNASAYLAEALDSVLTQTFSDLEVVAIDDRSTDGSADILRSYAARDTRVRFLTNPANAGMVANWNRCLREAQGEFIKFLFGDDRFASPDGLRRMVAVMDAEPAVSLVASARNVIDRESRVVRQAGKFGTKDIVLAGGSVIRDCMIAQRNLIGEPSVVLFRRSQAGRGFDERYRQIVDLEMWLRLLDQGDFAYLHEALCSFRIHEGQATVRNLERSVHIDEQVMLVRERAGEASLGFTRLELAYMRFVPCVKYWEQYRRHGRLSRAEALGKIRGVFSGTMAKFRMLIPFYKLYTTFRSISRRMMILSQRRLLS